MLVHERGVLQRDIGTYECCVDDLAADASAATAAATTSPTAAAAACRVPASGWGQVGFSNTSWQQQQCGGLPVRGAVHYGNPRHMRRVTLDGGGGGESDCSGGRRSAPIHVQV